MIPVSRSIWLTAAERGADPRYNVGNLKDEWHSVNK